MPMPCLEKHPDTPGLLCFLPEGHMFVGHIARELEKIFEWGEPRRKPTLHDHSDGLCDLLGHDQPAKDHVIV